MTRFPDPAYARLLTKVGYTARFALKLPVGEALDVRFWRNLLFGVSCGNGRSVPNSVYRYSPSNVGFRASVTTALVSEM